MAKNTHSPLQDLQVSLGASLPNFTQQKFRQSTAHIALMFLRALKQRSNYVLDGSPLVFLHFGIPEAQRDLLGKAHYFRESQGRWSSCCVPKFDWDAFSALTEREQDEASTGLIEKTLLKVAKISGADPKPIKAAAKTIRANDYTLRVPIERLTCENDRGDKVAHVYSVISRGTIRWQIEIQDAEGRVLQTSFVPDACARPDFTEDRVTTRWKKNSFSIVQANGRAAYSLVVDR